MRTQGPASGPVVVLAGGTGGAKLARGMLDVVGSELVVIANTGDDIEIYGSYVSPDADLVTFWLADRIDERGWGLRDDTFGAMEQLRELGVDVWFNLGDRDLAICLQRARMLREGKRQTHAQAAIATALGIRATVLPMSDDPVRTAVLAAGRWWPLQEFMIRHRGAGPVRDVAFHHARAARPTDAVLDAIARARAIVIGPSNPVISIGPILSVPGLAAAIAGSTAPVLAVSPLVGGRVLKGPTAACLQWAGRTVDSDGIAACYEGLLDGLVADAATTAVPTLTTPVLLDTPARRRSVAEQTLAFAASLSRSPEA
ncbi:MAG TPA: 2-phospho-L-lactate transferase [Solirubrobacteraceae bacterium]|nr:2-phospho-L-lactate transferase [Solirubrobacteraceae bacterium]